MAILGIVALVAFNLGSGGDDRPAPGHENPQVTAANGSAPPGSAAPGGPAAPANPRLAGGPTGPGTSVPGLPGGMGPSAGPGSTAWSYAQHAAQYAPGGSPTGFPGNATGLPGYPGVSQPMPNAGGDPVAVAKRYAERIVHVHCKDIRRYALTACRRRDVSFSEAVLCGIFTAPGDGMVNFPAVFDILAKAKYGGWLVQEAEQDPRMAHPATYAELGRAHMAQLCGNAKLKLAA